MEEVIESVRDAETKIFARYSQYELERLIREIEETGELKDIDYTKLKHALQQLAR